MHGVQFTQSFRFPTAGRSSPTSRRADNTNEIELPSYNGSQKLFPHRPTNGDRKELPESAQPPTAAPAVPRRIEGRDRARTLRRSCSLLDRLIPLCRLFSVVIFLALLSIIVVYSLRKVESVEHEHEHEEAQDVRGPVYWPPTTTNHTMNEGATVNSTLDSRPASLNGTGTERAMEGYTPTNSNDMATEEDRAALSELRMVLLLEDIFAKLRQDLEAKKLEEPRQRRMVGFVA